MDRHIFRLFVSSVILLSLLRLQCYETASTQPRRTPQKGLQSRQSKECNSKNEFTCGNNQCIPLSSMCNGLNDCKDGADENSEHCMVIQTGSCTTRKRTSNFCDETEDRLKTKEENATARFFCHSDILKKEKSLPLSCSNRIWTPTSTHCIRVCEPITLPTSNVTCLRNGKKVDCTQPLLVGTKIYPQCEFYYRANPKEIVCDENGEWSEKSVQCIPECGRQFKDKMRYTRDMRTAEFREFPWSVAIYYTKPGYTVPILIPGTIVSPYLIITTAINFYNDYQAGILTTESLSVIVAKRTKEAEAMDDQFQKSYKVRGIFFTETGFQNFATSLSSENIALIELDEKLVLSPSVYPACVNWEKNETLYPRDGDIGQVPHTLTIHEANATATLQHEILQTLALRFVSHDQCINTDAMKSMSHVIRVDNFCGEPIYAPAPCDGAFIFLETNTNRFYVQGLVDGITPSLDNPPTFTNTFTDLSAHIDWMNAVRKTNEDRLVNNELILDTGAVDSSSICTKNNELSTDEEINTRFGKKKENVPEEDIQKEKSNEGCLLPTKASLNANSYSISCPVNSEDNSCRRIKENTTVPEYTSVKIDCKKDFGVNKSNEEVVCFKGQWNPILVPCTKLCDKLPKFDNGNFTCYENDELVKCTDKLKIGSTLIPQCNAAYKIERDAGLHVFSCEDDGKWLGILPKCIKKSAKEGIQSKSNNPSTRTQAKENQPSLYPRSPTYSSPNSKGTNINQASPKLKDSIQPRENQQPGTNENEDINKDGECSKDEFSCGKSCIPNSAVCNGTIECDDGTDESSEFCKIIRTNSCNARTASVNYCDNQATSKINPKNHNIISEKPVFMCNTKNLKSTDGIPLNCVNSVSTPSTIPCMRVCKNITLIASGLDCYRNNVSVDCKKPLLSGTKVVPRCELGYKANFNYTLCNEKGEWDQPIIECIPECGKSAKNSTKMTKTIRPAQFREFPWNVAVYRKTGNTSVLFAGVIISPNLVLTNAHCCAKEMSGNEANMDMFEVVVAKRSSESDIEDDDFQKTIKVKAVHLFDNTNPNSESLAIIELADKIISCPAIQPVCVNWYKNETLTARDGTLGMVAHWRTRDQTNTDTTHEMLQTVAMTLHNTGICQKRVHKDFIKFLMKDAFCVEPVSVTTPAHRGAGFTYEDQTTKLNYVQGIIYFTGIQKGQTASFTNMFLNVTAHIDWINSIRRKNEKRLHREWILNTRVIESEDACESHKDIDDNTGNYSNSTDTQDDLNPRSDFTNNQPDDFTINGCELPDKTWLYLDYNVSCLPSRWEKECKTADSDGGRVPEFASLRLSCNEGYVTNGTEEVVCFRKQWSPPIEPCRKICDKLVLENVTLKCFWEDKRIDCNSELKSGTKAVVECAPFHQSQKALPKLLCDDYGHWKGVSEVSCSYFNPWDEQGAYFKYTMNI